MPTSHNTQHIKSDPHKTSNPKHDVACKKKKNKINTRRGRAQVWFLSIDDDRIRANEHVNSKVKIEKSTRTGIGHNSAMGIAGQWSHNDRLRDHRA